jgi:NAD(P)-dependent dehydrogenase (short-subunit alcohol dehydrogenase family)
LAWTRHPLKGRLAQPVRQHIVISAVLTDRVVAVTGAGNGIGAAVTAALVTSGARVAAFDVDTAGLAAAVAAAPDHVQAVPCDITDEPAVVAGLAAAQARFGRLDGLVNAAGVVDTRPFLEFELAHWERVFRVHLWGSYLMIKHAVPHLRAAGGGAVVNFSSSGGKLANPFTAPYAASKAAVISLTRSAAGALAPQIRVNAVVPGIIDTPMWGRLDRDFAELDVPISMAMRSAGTPMQRPGLPDEVAAVVLFLLGDESRYITGEDLNVSGGQVMF